VHAEERLPPTHMLVRCRWDRTTGEDDSYKNREFEQEVCCIGGNSPYSPKYSLNIKFDFLSIVYTSIDMSGVGYQYLGVVIGMK